MTSPRERLEALIAFAKESAQLRTTPPQHVSQHKQFSRFEENFRGLPGLSLNIQEDTFDEIWLCLDRLHESKAPIPESTLLEAWIDLSNNPYTVPTLKACAERQKLTEIGGLVAPAQSVEHANLAATESSADYTEALQEEPSPFISLEDFADRESVEKLLKSYIETIRKPWAAHEKEVRRLSPCCPRRAPIGPVRPPETIALSHGQLNI